MNIRYNCSRTEGSTYSARLKVKKMLGLFALIERYNSVFLQNLFEILTTAVQTLSKQVSCKLGYHAIVNGCKTL